MKQAQVLTAKDQKRVLAYIARSSYPKRNRAMFMLSWCSGMRVGEIASLLVRDVLEADGRSGIKSSSVLHRPRATRPARCC